MSAPRTLYDKIWDDHLVNQADDGTCLLYIDRHLVHEVTSPQAFEGLRMTGRKVRAPQKTLAVVDHNVPTSPDRHLGIKNEESRIQVEALAKNAADFGVEYYSENDKRQGIVHIVGPEQGFTLPGMTIVCGDSHTSTHGAFGALAHGIGTSEVEHVLATQTLIQKKAKNMLVRVDGKLPEGVTAKDIILAIIGEIGTAGGTGHVIEFAGEAIRSLSMEGRMTVCNMAIEAGARAGLIAPDEKTFDYLRGRATLKRVYVLIDSRHGIKKNDDEVLTLLDKAAVSYQIVLTKTDKIKEAGVPRLMAETLEKIKKHPAAFPEVLATSSEKADGLEQLRGAITEAVKQGL